MATRKMFLRKLRESAVTGYIDFMSGKYCIIYRSHIYRWTHDLGIYCISDSYIEHSDGFICQGH